jgi:hypothetical protein
MAALFFAGSAAAGQVGQGVVRGGVIDSSGGLLPGVTVTATSRAGSVLATEVTNARGEFVLPPLPAQPIMITFELEGFTSTDVAVTLRGGEQTDLLERLDVASFSEAVVVVGVIPPAPPVVRPLPPPHLAPVTTPVPVVDRDSFCGPARRGEPSESLGTIASNRDGGDRGPFGPGAELAIRGGLDNGLEVGRNLIVRRQYRVTGATGVDAVREHSAGLLQIVETSAHASVAVVVYTCDEMMAGDFLASFAPGPTSAQESDGAPDYRDATRILFADEGQMLGAPRRLMVIGRGTAHGTFVGQRFTLFRQTPGSNSPVIVGDAVVVAARTDSATIRVDRVNDIVSAGDWAAPHAESLVRAEP